MKKIGFAILGIVLLAGTCKAQDESPNEGKRSKFKTYVCSRWSCLDYNKTKIGIRGGTNTALVAGADLNDKYLQTGYHAGIFVKAAIRPSFAIQPEINIANKPVRLLFVSPSQRGTGVMMLDYLELPLLAVYNITEAVSIHYGIYNAFIVNARPLATTNAGNLSFETDADLNYYDGYDYGGIIGAGYEKTSWAAGIRYVQGARDVGEKLNFTNKRYNLSGAYNSVFQVYLALTY